MEQPNSGIKSTRFSVVRYGNVMGSRGSVIPFFLKQKSQGFFPITDKRMTRFMITLEEGVQLVWDAFEDMIGGEIYVKKIKSMNISDIANAIDPEIEHKVIGIRPGEKLHEQMIAIEDAPFTYEYDNFFKILPAIYKWNKDHHRIGKGKLVDENFTYNSRDNLEIMRKEELKEWITKNF